MQIQQESYADVLKDIGPLLSTHWAEIETGYTAEDLQPSWEMYDYLAEHDHLHITTVRQDDGELVGYCVYLLSKAMHCASEIYADNDTFWLHPDHRKGMLGIRMLKSAEDSLRTLGVTRVLNKYKVHKDLGKLFERLGYEPIETVVAKRLD